MRGKYTFREPLLIDDEGLYITAAQMQFFLNRSSGKKQFKGADPKFLSYYNNCRLYNFVYDMMEDDPECARIYWDGEQNSIGVAFPMRGKIAQQLASFQHWENLKREADEDDEDDDPYGIFT